MISCADFIPAYSELFKFLEQKGGKAKVVEFWNYIADHYLANLRELAAQHGLRGCWMYWSRTLNEEAADFTMELDEARGELRFEMHRCPSKGRLLQCRHLTPYVNYCEHCDVLYRRVLAPLGLDYRIDLTRCGQAQCAGVIRKVADNKRRTENCQGD